MEAVQILGGVLIITYMGESRGFGRSETSYWAPRTIIYVDGTIFVNLSRTLANGNGKECMYIHTYMW